ncbi:MAG: hypothetical protein ACLGHD_02285, partial [Actinomycetes bacterium]
STLDAQFEALEDVGRETEIEARLAALKHGGAQGQLGSGANAALGGSQGGSQGAGDHVEAEVVDR